ncbi:MAG: GNAT family N-acetyltransferase [Methanobacteriota archaeon]|nr:MAG: GNAT family N-acetyltransferase [Euryarchaeota archaeon]
MIIDMARARARPLESEDAEFVFSLMNDVAEPLSPSSSALETPVSIERVRSWIREVNRLKSEMHMVLSKRKGGSFGLASVTEMNLANRSARVAFLMPENDWRRGYGTEAIGGVVDFLFSRFNLHRIWTNVAAESELMTSAFSEAGFELEGTLKHDRYSGGGWKDSRLMSTLSDDFWGMPND